MGGTPLIGLLLNIILFTFIFWLLIFMSRYFFFKEYTDTKNVFFECGFKAYEAVEFKITSGVLILAILLVIYDIEFLLLLPWFSNFFFSSLALELVFIFILILIGFILYIDNIFIFLHWVG